DRRLRDTKATRHHADRGRAASQTLNDPAADRVGNRPERIVSHSGNYSACPIAMALNSLPGECRTMSPRTRSAMPAGLDAAAAVACAKWQPTGGPLAGP